MSDTARPSGPAEPASPARRKGGCCGKLAGAGLLLALLGGAYVASVAGGARSKAPLDFEPFAPRPLEKALLTGKFELLEVPGRLTGGTAEVALNERELNLLLFGEAGHGPDHKARVRLAGDVLAIERSVREGERWTNVELECRLSLGPDDAQVTVLRGRIGDWNDALARAVLARALRAGVMAERARNPRLRGLKALWVEGDRVKLVYDPAARGAQ